MTGVSRRPNEQIIWPLGIPKGPTLNQFTLKTANIEVTIGRDRMSEAQHKTKEAIESCGGIYYVATTFENFYSWSETLTHKDG